MEHETAGDPMSELKWTRKTTEKISCQLKRLGITTSARSVARLLKQLGYSLRVNHKNLESGNKNPPPREVRNQQFIYINRLRKQFAREGNPIISVDCKKKEPIGNFKNNGSAWAAAAYKVNDHDFRTDAQGMAVPYGILDPEAKRGFVVVGTSHETPAMAVDSIVLWWKHSGSKMYPKAKKLLILADCGGGNGARARAWKYRLVHQLSTPYNLSVTVCHYPAGASKWNPIEHGLFSAISQNWKGVPLRSYETVLKYIRRTVTTAGLKVRALLRAKFYPKGESVSDSQMRTLPIIRRTARPQWNYTLLPSKT